MDIIRKYWYIFLVLIIEGSALMAVELLGAKLLAPFYGSSLYVWTAILAITVLGLTLGYHFGGIISAKQCTEKHLMQILAIASLFVFALPVSAALLISLTSGMGLISGVCVSGFLLLVPPMFCFGLVGPIVVRLRAQKIETLGNTAGTVYFTSTIGGILATFLFGFYWIPELGLKFSAVITACTLAFLPLIFYIKSLYRNRGKTPGNVKLKQEESVPPRPSLTKVKNNRQNKSNEWNSVYLYAAMEGAVVMAVELIAARMMAPYFGSSLFVWVSVIGITLLSLALGYFAGGKLADKYARITTIYWVMLFASCFLMLMQYSSQSLILALMEMEMSTAAAVVGFLLILPPLACLGMLPTLLIRHLTTRINDTGLITGRVFTISSASGIIALPLIGFYIIPEYGLTGPSILIGLLVGMIPFFRLLSQKKYSSLLFILVFLISFSQRNSISPSPDLRILAYKEGLLGQILVADVFKNGSGVQTNDRLLFINRIGQTFVDNNTHNSKWNYITFSSAIVSKLPENSKALVLGLGGGTVANVLHNNLKFSVDAVELDERIVETAKQYFSLNPDINVTVDDARHYLEESTQSYDLIFFDVFRGDIQPAHVMSLECFKKAKSLLNKNGLIIVNFNGFLNGDAGKPGRSVYATLLAAGLDTKIFPTPGREDERNTLFVASAGPQDFHQLRSPLFHSGKPVGIDSLFFDTSTLNLKGVTVFTDDRSGLDRLNIKANHIWRKAYNVTYTRFFMENGIPIFN